MGISKNLSMDWRLRPGGPAVLSEKQKKSMEEIRAHKERIRYATLNVERAGNGTVESDEDLTKPDLYDNSKTSFFGCVCNVANTLLVSPSGSIGMPFS